MRTILTIALLLTCSTVAHAQSYSSSNPYPPNNEFGVWGAYSFSNDTMIGTTTDRQIGVIALRYSRTIFDRRNVALLYTLDIVPMTLVTQPKYVACGGGLPYPGYCSSGRESVYGGGINPIGLKLNFRRMHVLQPFIASTAGFVASVRPVPVDIPGGTQFNFTFDFQAGMQLFNSNRTRAWTFGFKYAHISNAYRHSFNPGVDANELFVGYSFFK
jgi:Lipid A 3-O-deacylase (PagL)